VGQVQISGASERAVQVNIEARRLAAYGLSIMQVREALARQNAEIPGGRIDAGYREISLRTLGRFAEPRDFLDLVVSTSGGTAVRLRDLGEVVDSRKEIRSLARLDGKPAVVLQVQRQSGANTVEVLNAIKSRLPRSRELLPKDVDVQIIQDQSRYINAAMHEIQGHLIAGSVLASIVVLLFMRSWRSTLIAAVAIPASIIATFTVMRFLDFTMINMTMLALVLMVGVVIDDAIVVLENVFHFIEEKRMPPMQAAVLGTKEIGLAVMATTFSLVIVFLPVSFLSSVTGRLLYEFGVTASVAIMVSLLVSFSLTPMMCSRLLKPPKAAAGKEPASRRGIYHLLEVVYLWCLRISLRFRWAVCLLIIGAIAANVPLYKMIKQDYVPTNVDEGEFEIRVTAREGASITTMDATLRAVEQELAQIQGVVHLLTTVGSRGTGGVNSGEVYVRLDDMEGRTFSLTRLWRAMLAGNPAAAFDGNYSQRDKMAEARRRLAKFADLRCSIRNLTSLRSGAPVDIDFVMTGPNLESLIDFSYRLRDKALDMPGIVDVDVTMKLDKPEMLVRINRERAAALGIDVQEIAETLRIAVGGDDRVSRYRDKSLDDAYDVELRLVGIDRANKQAISQLYVRAHPAAEILARGAVDTTRGRDNIVLARLDNVVQFVDDNSPSRIDRLDRERMVALRANVAGGYALGDRIDALREACDELGLPPGVTTKVLGRGKELERTFRDFAWTFVLSFIFMYIILAAQFEHLFHPLTILISLPLAVPFGLLSLYLGGETLNLYSALGILVLFGVVKKNSILQVDHTNQLRARGMSRYDAIIQANRDRLRPILMTTIAFVAGLLPLLIGTGPGAEERRSIAVLASGGQTMSLLLTLLATPVIYSILDDIGALLGRLFRPRREVVGAIEQPVEAPVLSEA
jgi:HAE1 family hydrophobic/amphiphilic exporter-1